eukprot:gnl/MRDRNA2_/MRDRNA2_89566_c0_seq1.p1 gnl/MRDRNA2_/MRDRNA2_89566_c0~~gnl/MRDRNA2_/MRDRNA2_89566_c0_seq1.p1  ORF type:complete len:179 (+),score=34.51 gnl/MRDRNA2_/MRDRNA2_89566_c0_seq1:23-559(+)
MPKSHQTEHLGSSKLLSTMDNLKLPVTKIEECSNGNDEIMASQPAKSARRICTNQSFTGQFVKKSKQSVSWRLILPSLDYREVAVEIQHSMRGHLQVLINGNTYIDRSDGLKGGKAHVKLADYSFDIVEIGNGSARCFKLIVDDVPFDELERWPHAEKTPKVRTTYFQHCKVWQLKNK